MLAAFPIFAILLMPALWLVMGRPRFLALGSIQHENRNPKISVVIPARDEEETLPRLLASLKHSSHQPHEIIVVDDGSIDDTARISRQSGARVVSPDALPKDWKGKPWACQSGARAATGDWLLFLDADTWLEPQALSSITQLAEEPDAVISICPYHKIETIVEECSSFFNLIMVAGSNAFGIPDATRQDSALFGQSLFIAKSRYEQVGGHEKVKDKILENFHLAEHLQKQGVPRHCYLGRGSLNMRMFAGGLPELWRSWKKGFASGAKQAHPRALILISLWLVAGMTTIVSLLVALAIPSPEPLFLGSAAAAYFFFALQCYHAFRLVGSFSYLNALFFPLSLLFYQTLFFIALVEKKRGVQTKWKGRDVH